MQIHEVKPKTKIKKKKRVGRGGKRGTYCGKGMKGQKSRAGAKMKPIVREILKRYPKLRGYKFSPLKKFSVVNVGVLDKIFENKDKISPKKLIEKGLIAKGKKNPVKILGKGETKKTFYVEDCLVSKSAKETIEKAGGKVKDINRK